MSDKVRNSIQITLNSGN